MSEFKRYKITYSILLLNGVVFLISSLLSRNLMQMDMEVLVHIGALFGPFTVINGEW